jgi:hypothetical protein
VFAIRRTTVFAIRPSPIDDGMSAESLDKVLRLASAGPDTTATGPGDDLRELARAVHLALTEACRDTDPAHAAELIYAAATAAAGVNELLYGDGLEDWVEATSAPSDSTQVLLAGAATKPYGDVAYADPGYIGGRKRYPIDEKHVKAAWSYINQAKNAARYTASQLSTIKGRIKSAMHKHGHGVNVEAAMTGGTPPVLAQLRDGEAWVAFAGAPGGDKDIPMSHAPHHGTHSHAHSVTMTHEHAHTHAGEGEHAGPAHGNNFGQKAWAAKGEAGWAARQHAQYTALASTPEKPTPPAAGSSGATSNQSASAGQASGGGLNQAAARSGSGLDAAARGSSGSSPVTYTGPAVGSGDGHVHAHGSSGARSNSGPGKANYGARGK